VPKLFRIGVATGLFFGAAMGVWVTVAHLASGGGLGEALAFGGALGAGAGLFFGVGMAAFSAWLRRRSESSRPRFEAQGLVYDGPANHTFGVVANGGWLWLTRDRLVFEPHAVNVDRDTWAVPRGRVLEAEPVRTFGLVPNGLRVRLEGGETRTFVVEGRERWLEVLSAPWTALEDE
jgi:hypothetical protein